MGDDRSYNQDSSLDRRPDTVYKFTPEEMRLLARCNKESFYQRSLPISTILGLGTYWCVKSGYLKAHPRWGASIKITGVAIVGYFIGKLSYHQKCAEYFMALPHSRVGELLRRRRGEGGSGGPLGGFQDTVTDGFGMTSLPSLGGLSSSDVYSDMSDSSRYTDLDTDRPLNDGLNDSFRPSLDYAGLEEDIIPAQAPDRIVTYEELRKKNRDDYGKSSPIFIKPQRPPQPDDMPSPPSPSYQQPQRPQPPDNRPKNLYGDVWER